MAGQKKKRSGATHYLTLEGLLEDVTYAELTILRRASYEYPEEITDGSFTKKEIVIAKQLVERKLLETNQEALGYVVRCTERGELAAGYITKRTVEKICKCLDDLIDVNDLGIVADSLPLLMYRVMNDYRSLEVFVSIADHHKMFARVSKTYEGFRSAKRAAQEHHQKVQVKIERSDPFVDSVRDKHHPDAVLSSDFEHGEAPFGVDTDDEEEEP